VSQLLDGVRVLDLTNVLAGPFCGYQLAQVGADVIKVEIPGSGDLARQLGADPELNRKRMGASFLAQNAGKRAVTINLKHPAGKAAFLRLIAASDAVVENFRPGVMHASASAMRISERSSRTSSPARSRDLARTGRSAPIRPTTRSSRGCPG
jgi:crotonobetainyl-CoA:carnitine CoA-transferase CaiB-like acyl-CoA transferase